jgi:toxin YoeB
LMTRYFTGTVPAQAPRLIGAEVLEETVVQGTIRRRVRLTFDTANQLSFEVRVWTPKPGSDGGLPGRPLLLTQPRFYQMEWAEMALKRGYVVCLYPGLDRYHQEAEFPGYDTVWKTVQAEYPDATWSEIRTKAWIASRALDHLLDPESGYSIAPGQVGMKILFTEQAWEDCQHWVATDGKAQKRINVLIRETCRAPWEGIGQPEPLRHILKGFWPRRITEEHRMVYRVENGVLMIVQLRYHYR